MNYSIKENPNKLSNEELYRDTDYLYELYHLAKLVYEAHKSEKPITEGLSEDEIEIMSEEELRCIRYIDELELFDWSYFETLKQNYFLGINFETLGSSKLIPETLLNLRNCLVNIRTRIASATDINYDIEFAEKMERNFGNLNYCVMCSFGIFDLPNGEIYNFIDNYMAKTNKDLIAFANSVIGYFNVLKPTLGVLDNNPDLALELNEMLTTEEYFELMMYADSLDLKDIYRILRKEFSSWENLMDEFSRRTVEGDEIEFED